MLEHATDCTLNPKPHYAFNNVAPNFVLRCLFEQATAGWLPQGILVELEEGQRWMHLGAAVLFAGGLRGF